MLTTTDLRKKVILELLYSKKCYVEESIDYEKFKILHSEYHYLPETYFASILGISYTNFRSCKNGYSNIIIFKGINPSLFNEVIEDLIKKGIVHYNENITYLKLLNILKHVPFLSENMLANLLGINTATFQSLKYGHSHETTILKKHDISDEEELIVQQLIKNKLIYPGMQLTYEKFKSLHNFFPNINEYRFAYILEIKKSMLSILKKGKTKPIILKSRVISFVEEQKNQIIDILINTRHAKLNEWIDKKRFYELYSGFEYISELNFAEIVLGMSYASFRGLKSGKKRTAILKDKIELTDSIRDKIFHDILKQFHLNEGDVIDYSIFCNILDAYKDILKELDLSKIVGIEGGQFFGFKYHYNNARIVNGVTREKFYYIKQYITENRFYSKEEIYSIVNKYGISIQDFIIYAINNRKVFVADEYMQALENNNGLFIGKAAMDKDFFIKELPNIKMQLNYIWYSLSLLDIKMEKDDIFQELMIYIFQNCGDLYYNFGNSEIFFQRIKRRAKRYIMGKLINEKNTKIKELTLSALEKERPLDINISFRDQTIDFENKTIDSFNSDEDIYEQLLTMLENGSSLGDCLTQLDNSNQTGNPIYSLIKEKLSKEDEIS